jgi:hypothetical protein
MARTPLRDLAPDPVTPDVFGSSPEPTGRHSTSAPAGLPPRVGSESVAARTVTVKVPLLARNVGKLSPTVRGGPAPSCVTQDDPRDGDREAAPGWLPGPVLRRHAQIPARPAFSEPLYIFGFDTGAGLPLVGVGTRTGSVAPIQ